MSGATAGSSPKQDLSTVYSQSLIGALAILPLIALVFPRFLAFAPAIIGVLGFLAFKPAYGRTPAIYKPAFGWALAIIALMIFGCFMAIIPEQAVERCFKASLVLLGGALLFSLIKALDDRALADFQKFFPMGVVAAGLLCVFELYARAPIYNLFHDTNLPADSLNLSFFNRSVVTFMLYAFLALFVVQYSRGENKWRNHLIVLISVLLLAALYKTHSQSAQMAFVVAGLVYLMFPYESRAAWFTLLAVLTVALFTAPVIAMILFHFFLPLVDGVDWFQRGYAPARMEIWDFVSRRAAEKPFFGHGLEATRFIKDFKTERLYHPSTEVLHPHNFAVQIWIEFGMLGLIFVTAFFADIVLRIKRSGPLSARLYLPIFCAAISIAATGYGLWQGWWLGTFCLLFAYSVLAEKFLTRDSAASASVSSKT